MVWSEPRVWIDGPFLLADQMNDVSGNLRETAPAKAREPGDIFYALRRNEIGRLALGPAGSYLTPGVAAPQWAAVPSPITTRGDLVTGGAGGIPQRYGTLGGIKILVTQDGIMEWEGDAFLDDWWTRRIWWSEDAGKDIAMAAGDYHASHILARNISMSGNINLRAPVTIIRCKSLSLGGNTVIRSRSYLPTAAVSDILAGGGSGGSGSTSGPDGASGGIYCGGGGEGGFYNASVNDDQRGADGGDSSGSFSSSSFSRVLSGRAVSGGGQGGNVHSNLEPPRGGGVVVICCESFSRNGRSITIDASGDSVPSPAPGRVSSGGGGGGVAVFVSKSGTPTATLDVAGGQVALASSRGGVGGDGTSYIGTAFPS